MQTCEGCRKPYHRITESARARQCYCDFCISVQLLAFPWPGEICGGGEGSIKEFLVAASNVKIFCKFYKNVN